MRAQLGFKGGAKLKRYLAALQEAAGSASAVRVGFLEKATYPVKPKQPLQHVAQVAFWNEFGTRTAPARPFFRGTIRREQGGWGDKLGAYLKAAGFDAATALKAMGIDIKEQITQTITTWPGDNAPSTIARKGFDHGLIDKGVMQRSTDFEVLTS